MLQYAARDSLSNNSILEKSERLDIDKVGNSVVCFSKPSHSENKTDAYKEEEDTKFLDTLLSPLSTCVA